MLRPIFPSCPSLLPPAMLSSHPIPTKLASTPTSLPCPVLTSPLPDITALSPACRVKLRPSPTFMRNPPNPPQQRSFKHARDPTRIPVPPAYSRERRQAVEHPLRQRRQLVLIQSKEPEGQMRQAVSRRPCTIHHLRFLSGSPLTLYQHSLDKPSSLDTSSCRPPPPCSEPSFPHTHLSCLLPCPPAIPSPPSLYLHQHPSHVLSSRFPTRHHRPFPLMPRQAAPKPYLHAHSTQPSPAMLLQTCT